ncbi:MAG: glycosyltransferase family 4 protein [Candidatus Omnitrophica bacterium]|nr:glycosyltransferase family 4 protein [Candidatus Omnitrophota bacterium]
MKILLLTTHLRMGGVPIYVVNLAASLERRGHRVFVASAGGELSARIDSQRVRQLKLDINTKSELSPRLLLGLYHLYWLVKEHGVDIVHTNTRVTQVMGEALAFLTGACHVSTCHGFFKTRLGRRICGCWGRKIIAISDAVREHLVNDFKIPKSRVRLIHNGIDLKAFSGVYTPEEKERVKRELGLRDGPVVGIIARLSSVKGHRYLVKAMRRVIQNIKDAQLLIVGEGEERTRLAALVEDLGLSGSVIFMGSVSDTARTLAVMDVFVLPSVHEGLGLSLLEALACSRPVIGSDVGGIYSVIKDNQTGLLVPPKDPEALAKAILRLLGERDFAARLGRDGREFVRENFSLEDMTTKVEELYKEALSS